MYRRPKFLEVLLEIRREMAAEADYDVDLFAERVRSGMAPVDGTKHELVTNGDLSADSNGVVPKPRGIRGKIIRK